MEEEKSRGAFYKWLLEEKRGKQTCMIGRAQGEEIIRYLKEKREKGEDDPEVRTKYDSALRARVKKKNYKLLSAVGLGDILCLPVKQVCTNQRTSYSGSSQRAVEVRKDHSEVDQFKNIWHFLRVVCCSVPNFFGAQQRILHTSVRQRITDI